MIKRKAVQNNLIVRRLFLAESQNQEDASDLDDHQDFNNFATLFPVF